MKIVNEWEEIGEARGSARTATRIVLGVFRRRLGEIPDGLRQRIEALPIATLEDLGEALLDFHSLDDAERWLADYAG